MSRGCPPHGWPGGGKRDAAYLLGPVIAISEADHAVIEGFKAAVADGDAKDVAAEIIEYFFATAGVLAVNNPFFLPE
jgi:hypothetical protein